MPNKKEKPYPAEFKESRECLQEGTDFLARGL